MLQHMKQNCYCLRHRFTEGSRGGGLTVETFGKLGREGAKETWTVKIANIYWALTGAKNDSTSFTIKS